MKGRWKPGEVAPYGQSVAQSVPSPKGRPPGSGGPGPNKGVYRPEGTQAGAPQGPTAPPLDPQYEAELATGRRQLALSGAESAYQTGQIKQDFGIEDQSNPYSRAALLKQSYEEAQRGTANSYAERGLGNSGSAGQMAGENSRQYSIGYDQLARQYQGAIHGVQYGQAQTAANYGTGMDQAAYEALLRALGGS